MEAILAMFMGFIFIFIAIFLVFYILGSLGLMGVANNTKTKGGWMAWLPIFNVYLMGKVAFSKVVGWAMVILTFINSARKTEINGDLVEVSSILPKPIASLAALALSILTLVVLYRIYKRVSDKAVVMLIFTILSCGLLAPIFLFAIRKNNQIA